eukprot:gene37645-50826_t
MPVSPKVEVARMRGSKRRRCNSSRPPASMRTPAPPPATMASICLKLWLTPRASKTQIGVSKPTKWPAKIARTPRWNSTEPMTSWRR